jgi:hypothetical protein
MGELSLWLWANFDQAGFCLRRVVIIRVRHRQLRQQQQCKLQQDISEPAGLVLGQNPRPQPPLDVPDSLCMRSTSQRLPASLRS